MNILVITRSSWREDNSVGNTMSNFFSGMKNVSISNLCFRDEESDNNVAEQTFHISDIQIIDRILRKSSKVGFVEKDKLNNQKNKRFEQKAKKYKYQLIYLIQDLVWRTNIWKSAELDVFLKESKPDVIFMPAFPVAYPYYVLNYISQKYSCDFVLFHADDVCCVDRKNFNIFYRINKMVLRKSFKKLVNKAAINYCISEIQKAEYEKIYNKKFTILRKGYVFDEPPFCLQNTGSKIKMVYAGNMCYGRDSQIENIAREICSSKCLNDKFVIEVYTTSEIPKSFFKYPCIDIKKPVSYGDLIDIQKNADILIHVESFEDKNKKVVHQSFSTKLVDYFHLGKCIFAVGPYDVASIDYLIKNDAAVVCTNEKEIETKLKMLADNHELLEDYGRKAWNCGAKNHNINDIQSMLLNDLNKVVSENENDRK